MLFLAVWDLQEGWGQTSRELFLQWEQHSARIGSSLFDIKAGFCLKPGLQHHPSSFSSGHWQSGWAHYREQNKRGLLILSLAACSETPLLFLIPGSDQHTVPAELIHWEFYFLGLINPLIPSCLSTGAAQVLRPGFWEDPFMGFYCVENEQNPPFIWADQRYKGLYELW